MYYLSNNPTKNSNYGNPMVQPFQDCIALPDELLQSYLDARGFVTLTLDGNTVTAVETNQTALDAYLAGHPDTEPEPIEQEKIRADIDFIAAMTGVEL